MADFLSRFSFDCPPLDDIPSYANPERERIRLIIMGSAEGVREQIYRMHQREIADVGSWSRLLPVPDSTEVMSILMLYRRR